jgi:hypothetical protein
MAAQWPVSKLDVINSALAETGNNLVNVLEDGSDEYNVCSPTYERALAVLLEDYNWGFATRVATLQPSPTAPANTDWDTQFPLPTDLLHLIWVKTNQNQGDPQANQVNQLTLYDIENGLLVLNARGGPPPPSPAPTPAIITIKYLSFNNADPVGATPLFVLALTTFVMSGIYRGLHGDPAEAAKLWAAGEQFAQRSRTRYDQQKPKRQFWNSRISASRRVRRPWPPIGNDSWGGSGIPS